MTSSPLIWQDGAPRSSLFGDIYYSLDDGLAESRAVFLAGCGLPERWANRSAFTVGELGFGTGLNIAALLHLWRATRPAGSRLHIFSLEAYPPPREDATRALAAWPELAAEAQALLAQWPKGRRGFHRLDLPGFDATLDLAVLPADEALAQWDGQADAWFLDGFSPALNPAMWSPQLMSGVAARSAPGAVAATFTVAGVVRRGLVEAGFEVAKRPGFGRKSERLEARMAGVRADPSASRVAIVGAGIAGAALARAFRALACEPVIFAGGDQPAASANPAALVTPALDAGGGPRAAFYAQAFARAVDLYEDLGPAAIVARGARQMMVQPKDAARFAAVAVQDLFDPGRVRLADGDLTFADAVIVRPPAVLSAWAGSVQPARVTSLAPDEGGWRLTLADGAAAHFDAVIVAAGWGTHALLPDLGLQPVRGQASWAEGAHIHQATTFGAYAIPMDGGVLFGATHDRNDVSSDPRPADDQRNLAALAQGLPDMARALKDKPLHSRAAIRVATPDRLPLAGQVAPGLWVLTGLGSRGFTTAPLLAEHVAAGVLNRPSPLPAPLAKLVSPRREPPRQRSG